MSVGEPDSTVCMELPWLVGRKKCLSDIVLLASRGFEEEHTLSFTGGLLSAPT